MTTGVQLLRLAEPPADRPHASGGGTDNAFGQLLRSMEQDMWRNAASGLPAGGPARSAPGKTASVETRADAPGIAEQRPSAAATTPEAKAAATVSAAPRPMLPVTQASAPTAQAQREYPAQTASAGVEQALPPLERSVQPATQATDPTERVADATRSRPVPAAYVSPPPAAAPFRVTVLPGDGAPFVSLRVAQADPDDLDTLDSHVRAALQQSGFRASKLVINGIDRNAPGETTHGD
ncbi:hypothetical protein BCO18430_07188 [Burkholderia contaminans]|uniref:hypothetical protein n=1 Tax=Burkholderia contaminans TaxID=488447 RepID=UPI001453C0E9|nr:hypothetical protein [Burkholderia contaminans]VWD47104.1 hypothetical protein BCO18430_07188 [Burkholderia contaminans]